MQKGFRLRPELHHRERREEEREEEIEEEREEREEEREERERGREKESGQRRKNRKIIVWLLKTNPCLHKEVGVLL